MNVLRLRLGRIPRLERVRWSVAFILDQQWPVKWRFDFYEVDKRYLSETVTESTNLYFVQSVDTARRVAVLKIPLGGPVFSGLQGLPGRQTAKTLTSGSCTEILHTFRPSFHVIRNLVSVVVVFVVHPTSWLLFLYISLFLFTANVRHRRFFFRLLCSHVDTHGAATLRIPVARRRKSMPEIRDEYKNRGL